MTWLLFMDESGHDHRHLPFEVRGGVALPVGQLWPFIEAWRRLEELCFGTPLRAFGKEAKGAKLLDRDRLRWSRQDPRLAETDRQRLARTFLEYGAARLKPTRAMFSAYGQASLDLAIGIFDLLVENGACLFASLVRRGSGRQVVNEPDGQRLRADHALLLDCFHDFLAERKSHGLIVMDETDRSLDRRFLTAIEAQFRGTDLSSDHPFWLIPSPLFVSSELSFGVQAADLCLYCINWGYRQPDWPDDIEKRDDIAALFGRRLNGMEWRSGDRRGVNLVVATQDNEGGRS